MGLGILQYSQDYDEKLPHYNYGADGGFWPIHIQPYVKNHQIFRCPSAPQATGQASVPDNLFNTTYGFPGIGGNSLYSLGGTSLTTIKETARTWMIVETLYQPFWNTGADRGYGIAYIQLASVATGGKPEDDTTLNHDYHLGGSNVLFADGHVKWLSNEALHMPNMWKL